jgi:hypothetical protein
LDQFVDPLDGQRIKTSRNKFPVALNIGFELLALVAHGSPLEQAGANALSVIDRCRGRGDDGPNGNLYVRLPTLTFLCGFQAYNEPLAAPNLDVVAVNQVPRLGYGLAVVAANQRLKAYEVTVEANGISPILCHPGLLERPQFARKELGDFR